jgi:tripartite ATP-independent transporter DctP family solute receptor
VLKLYYWDYIYTKNGNHIISLGTSNNKYNKISKGFLDITIFTSDGTPIENAYIRIFEQDELYRHIVRINTNGYYPTQINNVQLCPGLVCKLKVNLIPKQLKDQILTFNQIVDLPSYENIQNTQNTSLLPQNDIRELTFSIGVDSPKDNVTYLYAENFAEEVYKLSEGKMKIEIFENAKMGADRQMIKTTLNKGYPDFVVQTTAPEVDFVPELSVFDMPMVYNNIKDLRNTVDNDMFYEKISNAYSKAGYKLLGIADLSFRQMTSNEEIKNIDDFKGIKIRTIQNLNHKAFWESLGSIVTLLPASEIYPGLKFGYIDNQENSYEVVVGFKLYEVQKYLLNTYHLPNLLPLFTSNELYNSLTDGEKAIIDEAAVKATAYSRQKTDERFEERKKILIEKGMKIIELPEETRKAMEEAALPLYKKIRNIVNDDDLVDFYLENGNII